MRFTVRCLVGSTCDAHHLNHLHCAFAFALGIWSSIRFARRRLLHACTTSLLDPLSYMQLTTTVLRLH